MDQPEKDGRSFGSAKGESTPPESPGQGKYWKGLSAQNAKIPSWTNKILPPTRVADALRYSWNAGPGADGDWPLETGNEATAHRDGCSEEPPKRGDEGEMEEEGAQRAGGPQPHPTKEVSECAESLTIGRGDGHRDVTTKDQEIPAEYIHASSPDSGTSDVKYGGKEEDQTWNGSWSLVPETLSEAFEDVPTAKEEAGGSADVEAAWLGGHTQRAPSQQEEVAEIEEPLPEKATHESLSPCPSPLRNSPGRQEENRIQRSLARPLVPPEAAEMPSKNIPLDNEESLFPCPSPLRNSPGRLEENRIQQSLARPLVPPEAAEMPSKNIPLDNDAGEPSGNVKTGEESKHPDEEAEMQAKCVSAKPVRFTIAPAWQRSLSGGSGSGSADGACLTSSPSSPPIKPELFEGTPQPDSALPGCLFHSPERLERSKSSTNAATERPNEEPPQGPESPFGVRLRRTSSLLKYHVEQQQQQRQELPKQTPPSASSVVARDEPKAPVSETPPPVRATGSARGLAAKPGFQGEKTSLKAKVEGGTTGQQMSRAPAKPIRAASREAHPMEKDVRPRPSLPLSSCASPAEPPWLSLAKEKAKAWSEMPQIVQ